MPTEEAREHERDEGIHACLPQRDPAAGHEPHEQGGRPPEPDVHESSSSDAARGSRSWTSASPRSGSRSMTSLLGAREAASVAQARRPRSTYRSPPAGNGTVRKAPRGRRGSAASTRKKSGTTRRS